MGLICLRLSKLYFGMLQLSLGTLVWVIVYRWYSFTNGDNGIHGINLPALISSDSSAYYFTLVITLACLYLMHKIVTSPFGSVLQAIRDNPIRSEMIGVNINIHRLAALVIGAFFAGIAGCLFVVVDGSVYPDMMGWYLSMEGVIMCLLGGWLTFLGPMVGTIAIVALRTFVGAYTMYWGLVLGIVMILVIFFLPEGVLGWLIQRSTRQGQAEPEMEEVVHVVLAGDK
jgi:branched-chain amino acid transport system permease protein